MRDAYQNILAKYPTLTAFGTVAADEVEMISDLKKVFARYKLAVPSASQASAVRTVTSRAASLSTAYTVAIKLEQSTATLMTQLRQRASNQDVLGVVALIKSTSINSHIAVFSAEKGTVAASTPTVPTVSRPFPAPVTTRTVTVPTSIDASGATDASPALNTFVASVPDGSIISFPTGATYRLDKGIQFANRHNLVFVGNGTTLKVGANASGSDQLASSFVLGHEYGGFWDGGNTDIAIRDFILVGNSPTPGVFNTNAEHLASFEVEGSNRVEISGCRSSAYYGDFVKVGDNSTSVWVHDNTVPTVGRNGGTIISGRDVTFERNTFGIVGYCVFDVEPNTASEATYNARFLANTAISWDCAFLSVEGSHTGAIIDGIVADGNTVTGGSIRTVIDNGGTARMKNVSFTNNTGKKADDGPVLVFANIDGLTVTGTVQSLTSATLMRITNSTGVTTS
jgi:hypothetical protein